MESLTGQTSRRDDLLDLEETIRRLKPFSRHYLGLRSIPVDRVVGTEGRAGDFDRRFSPPPAHVTVEERLDETERGNERRGDGNVDASVEAFPAEVQGALREVRRTIHHALPDAGGPAPPRVARPESPVGPSEGSERLPDGDHRESREPMVIPSTGQ